MNKIALITGASGGVGRAVAAEMAADGWTLVLAGRDASRLREVHGSDHFLVEADCSTYAGARHIVQAAGAAGLHPTALAHCVGNIRLGAMHRMSEADFMDCLSANLISAFHTLAAFIEHLRHQKQTGAAVLVSSAAARIGTPNHEAIAAAKAGVEGLVRGAAATHAPFGIRINAVAPGIMDTPASAALLSNDSAREAAARQYPLPGIGSSAQLAGLIAWLLSEKSARVTGEIWAMDGGFSAIRPLVK